MHLPTLESYTIRVRFWWVCFGKLWAAWLVLQYNDIVSYKAVLDYISMILDDISMSYLIVLVRTSYGKEGNMGVLKAQDIWFFPNNICARIERISFRALSMKPPSASPGTSINESIQRKQRLPGFADVFLAPCWSNAGHLGTSNVERSWHIIWKS